MFCELNLHLQPNDLWFLSLLIANRLLVQMVRFPHLTRPFQTVPSCMHVSIVKKAGLALAKVSWTSSTAMQTFLPALAGYRWVPVLGEPRCVLPLLQRDGCLSGNMRRWTRTLAFSPYSCKSVVRKDGLIACSALKRRGRCDVPAELGQVWAVSAGKCQTCAVAVDGRLTCLKYGQCDVPADVGPVLAGSAGGGHTCAVRADGRLFIFGCNNLGQCGVPNR